MAILVCGGAGYIGSHAVCALQKSGEQVVVLDNLATGHRNAIPAGARAYFGDLRDRAILRKIFDENKIEGVFHFAASSLVGESMVKPLLYFDNNVYSMIVLLEQMVESAVDKIVFSSTCAVYGNSGQQMLDENSTIAPQSAYGQSKAIMENIMQWVDRAHKVRYVSLRYFNAAGASGEFPLGEDHRPETHLIPLVLRVALGQLAEINIFGDDYATPDGTCVRDYIHVEDIAAAHLDALNYLRVGKDSDVFNLGSGSGYSVDEIVRLCRKITGKEIKARYTERRPGDPDRLVSGSTKAGGTLGWRPKHGIEDIINSAWNWHKNNPQGYSDT